MRRNRLGALVFMWLAAGVCLGQVLNPAEIKNPELSSLQQQYMDDLQAVGRDILASHFSYPFYLSRKLDLDQAEQQRADQRSIRFDTYDGHTALAITGNYFAAYSSRKMNEEERARATFFNVIVPILQAAVPRFQSNREIQGYAVEVSHHILGSVMGVAMERPENLMVYLPQRAAIRLIGSKDQTVQQAALLEGKVFLNAEPVTIWVNGEAPQTAAATPASGDSEGKESSSREGEDKPARDENPIAHESQPSRDQAPKPQDVPVPPQPRDLSPQALAALQSSNEVPISRLTKELDPQVHFVAYAPPRFVPFRQGIYLEMSLNTSLPQSANGSRYKLAALAFDDHIAHLVRPVLTYFQTTQSFDGIGFSTTVHLAGKTTVASSHSEAVEFFFPFSALRCYASYDCTGQQLIDAGTILINGERVALDLEIAEGGSVP